MSNTASPADSVEVLPITETAAASTIPARAKRSEPQLLHDELGEDLIAGAPSRNGGRLLEQGRDPWTHNAWDKVEWDEEQEQLAKAAVEKQMSMAVPPELQEEYNANPASFWDSFYSNVKDGFFNDRAWLRTEFSDLADAVKADAGPKTVVEIGCGPGNTLFPLFAANENPDLQIHGYDFSAEAVKLVKSNPAFDPKHCTTGVWDLSSKAGIPETLQPGSVDIAIMIFVLSALHPEEWAQAVENAWTMLKPGGILLFRDYGRNDMAQLRFKGNRYMQPGLYVRGDHTRVYFFERDELVAMFGGTKQQSTTDSAADSHSLSSLSLSEAPTADSSSTTRPSTTTAPTIPSTTTPTTSTRTSAIAQEALDLERTSPHRFELLRLGVDRRLLLNRKKQLKMYRVWQQGRWRKPLNAQD